MRLMAALLLALALFASDGAQSAGRSRDYWGMGNTAPSGMGRNADTGLPLLLPRPRRPYQGPLDDLGTRSPVRNPFVGRPRL
jgi:hypothetical protein